MRVTLAMQATNTSEYLREAAEKLMNAQQLVTSGKKITKPSDDPTLTGRSMSLQSAIRGLDQLAENNNLAKSMLSSTDDALGSINDEVQQLRQVAMQAGNSSLSSDARQGLLAQLDDIRSRLLSLGDTKFMNRYIFSGAKTTTPPVAASGGTPPYTYQGDQSAVQLQVQPDLQVQINVTGDKVFNLDGSAGAGIKDIFSVMQDLQTAISAGDVTSSSGLLSQIDGNLTNVLAIRGEIGAREQRLDDNATALTDSKNRMSELLSNLQDVDITQAIVDFQTQQNLYQAALSVASKVGQVSLVDYLR